MFKSAMDFNATVTHHEEVSPDLIVLRVRPRGTLFPFQPGQYGVLGLPGSAPRVPMSAAEDEPPSEDKLIRRAYSIASSSKIGEYLEFYIKLVRTGELTPRLFSLKVGDQLWLGPKTAGHFTLDSVPADMNLVLVATGTGLAPYVSMIRTAHRCGVGPVHTVVHGARNAWDLGYRSELEALNHGCGNFIYHPTLSRPEPREQWRGHVGRVNSVFKDGTVVPNPTRDHVFLCGAPEMVEEMQAYLQELGYRLHSPRDPGNLHVERYW